jgi:DNA helicase II / ATP-dependent DNA helicase PcrA
MIPSKEQQDIYDFVSNSKGNLIVEASAGSGKTTVLIETTKLLDPEKKVLLCAFNKAIADELNERTPPHTECRTTHSLAKRYCDRNLCQTNPKKLHSAIDYLVNGPLSQLKMVLYESYKDVTSLVGMAKAYLLPPRDKKAFADLIKQLGLSSLALGVEELAYAAFNMTALDLKSCDFDDQLYFTVMHKWFQPEYDIVLADEMQDMSKVQHELIKGILKPEGRLICVGDPKQSIYRFRGTQSNTMSIVKEEFKCNELPLHTTWRCPQAVVALANEIVPNTVARLDAKEGNVQHITFDDVVNKAYDNDFYIARTNSLVVKMAMRFLNKKKPFRVQNKDQIRNAIKKVKKWTTKKRYLSADEIIIRCKKHRASNLGENDDIQIIASIALQYDTSDEILDALQSISGSRHRKGPLLMTVHGAKGLETDNVFLCIENLPHEKTKPSDIEGLKQEINMAYVAITRAQKNLYLVQEDIDSDIEILNDPMFMQNFRNSKYKTKPYGDAAKKKKAKSNLKVVVSVDKDQMV